MYISDDKCKLTDSSRTEVQVFYLRPPEIIVTDLSPLLNEWCWIKFINPQSGKDWRTLRVYVQGLKTHRECRRTSSHCRAPRFVLTDLAFTLHSSPEHSWFMEVYVHRIFKSLLKSVSPGLPRVLCSTVTDKLNEIMWIKHNRAYQYCR